MRMFFQEAKESWRRFVERDNAEFLKNPNAYRLNFWRRIRPIVFVFVFTMMSIFFVLLFFWGAK